MVSSEWSRYRLVTGAARVQVKCCAVWKRVLSLEMK